MVNFFDKSLCSNQVMLIKALMAAHDILLEDLRRLSTGINIAIDLTEIVFESDDTKWLGSPLPANVKSIEGEQSLQLLDGEEVSVRVPNSVSVCCFSVFYTTIC